MKRIAFCFSALAVLLLATTAQAVTIDMVPVGNPGNANDTYGEGGVDYAYNIGKYEVTAGQYCEFLNAVDPNGTNTLGLYNPLMNIVSDGCQITWHGSDYDFSGAHSGTASDWENRPVNFVSFWDAARFANWLHNGQGDGDTESGAYHDIGDPALFGRNAGAQFFIPSDDEWYKAAYHDKSAGLAATYFDYPTNTDSVPGRDMSEITNPGNNANYYDGSYLIGSPYYRTEVGEFELSESPYGTFDQGGNVWEWNETADSSGFHYGLFGGDYAHTSSRLGTSRRTHGNPARESAYIGFRVASVIPEPSTLILLTFLAKYV